MARASHKARGIEAKWARQPRTPPANNEDYATRHVLTLSCEPMDGWFTRCRGEEGGGVGGEGWDEVRGDE